VVISNFSHGGIIGRLSGTLDRLVIFDMAPSLDVCTSAIMASDWVLIPTKLDAMAIDGVNKFAFHGEWRNAASSGLQHPPHLF